MARERDFGTPLTSEQLSGASEQFSLNDDTAGDSGSDERDSAGTVFDPERHVGIGERKPDGTFKRKRGRRAGTGSASVGREKKTAPSVNAIEQSLIGIHALLAAATKTPELVLDTDESKPLALAVTEVAKHYDIPGLDAKTTAWVGLILVCGKVYVPRAVMIKQRMEQEAKEKRPVNVTPLRAVETERSQPEKPNKRQKQTTEPQVIDPLNPPLGYPV